MLGTPPPFEGSSEALFVPFSGDVSISSLLLTTFQFCLPFFPRSQILLDSCKDTCNYFRDNYRLIFPSCHSRSCAIVPFNREVFIGSWVYDMAMGKIWERFLILYSVSHTAKDPREQNANWLIHGQKVLRLVHVKENCHLSFRLPPLTLHKYLLTDSAWKFSYSSKSSGLSHQTFICFKYPSSHS